MRSGYLLENEKGKKEIEELKTSRHHSVIYFENKARSHAKVKWPEYHILCHHIHRICWLRLEWIEWYQFFCAQQRKNLQVVQTKTRFLVTAGLIPNPERNQQPWEHLRRERETKTVACAPNSSIAARMSRKTLSWDDEIQLNMSET